MHFRGLRLFFLGPLASDLGFGLLSVGFSTWAARTRAFRVRRPEEGNRMEKRGGLG